MMAATVAPAPLLPGLGTGLWSDWAPRGDHWQFALHASRPLTPDEIHRLIKLNAALGRAALVLARPTSWPSVKQPWYNVDISSLQHPEESVDPDPAPPEPPRPGHAWWESWLPAGALLLVLLTLIARATDRCLANRLRRRRAQRAEEWTIPNVLATSNQDESSAPRAPPYTSVPMVTLPASTINITTELPPPYSECANASSSSNSNDSTPSANGTQPSDTTRSNRHKRSRRIDEPPPPYTAVFANYTIPKHGEPTVHLYNQRGNLSLTNDVVGTENNMTRLTEYKILDTTTNLVTFNLCDNHINMLRMNTRRPDDIAHGGYRVGRHGTDQTPAYYEETPENESATDNVNVSQSQRDINSDAIEIPCWLLPAVLVPNDAPDLHLREHTINTPGCSTDATTNSGNNSPDSVTAGIHRRNNVVAFLKDDDAKTTFQEMDLDDDDVRLGDLGESTERSVTIALADTDDEDERFDEVVIKALDDAEAQIRNGDPNPRA